MNSADQENPYPEWTDILVKLSGTTERILIIGGSDTGKTTFTRELINSLVSAGQEVHVLDCDIGQSEIGPPGCVGCGAVTNPLRSLSEIPSPKYSFVGAVSPANHLGAFVRAVSLLLRGHRSGAMVVDTGGFIHGREARELIQTLFELVEPAHVVAMQRHGELEGILSAMRRKSNCEVFTPVVPAAITKKTTAFRRQRRSLKFSAYFQNSEIYTYQFEEVGFTGVWLGGGVPAPAHILKFINQSIGHGSIAYYAETLERQLFLMTNKPVSQDSPEIGLILQHLKMKSLTSTCAPSLKHLLLGLVAGNGNLLGLGILEAVDFRRRTLGVRTPVRTPSAAVLVQFGYLRVQADGTEVGTVSPSELG